MTRNEYERRRQQLDEELRAGIQLLESAHRLQVGAGKARGFIGERARIIGEPSVIIALASPIIPPGWGMTPGAGRMIREAS
jgi:hypothetical protein